MQSWTHGKHKMNKDKTILRILYAIFWVSIAMVLVGRLARAQVEDDKTLAEIDRQAINAAIKALDPEIVRQYSDCIANEPETNCENEILGDIHN